MHSRHERVSRLGQTSLGIARSGDGEWIFPPSAKHRVGQQLRDAGAVIGVDMRQQNEIDARVLDAQLVESNEARSAKVDRESEAWDIDENTSLKSPAGPKGIARSDECYGRFHGASPSDDAAGSEGVNLSTRQLQHFPQDVLGVLAEVLLQIDGLWRPDLLIGSAAMLALCWLITLALPTRSNAPDVASQHA